MIPFITKQLKTAAQMYGIINHIPQHDPPIYSILCSKVSAAINYNEVSHKTWLCAWSWQLRFFTFDKLFSSEALPKLNLEVRQ